MWGRYWQDVIMRHPELTQIMIMFFNAIGFSYHSPPLSQARLIDGRDANACCREINMSKK